MQKIEAHFDVKSCQAYQAPKRSTEIAMYFSQGWHLLSFKQASEALPTTVLHQQLIEPILNINDPRTDERMHFIGGLDSPAEIENQVKTGQYRLGFILYPTSMQQLMAIADSDQIMPPKSTWFEPKLADGLISFRF